MKAEIIAVGTELLLGQIVNTNAQHLAEQCAAVGVDVYFQTVVGDNPERLRQALEIATSRADVVICTGGLGPTQDDLTKDVLAEFLGKALVPHEPSMARIRDVFEARGIHMVESNARQALMLTDSVPFLNGTGLAVGLGISSGGCHYMLLPGPPREMKTMFESSGKPWLAQVQPGRTPLYSKMLKFAGIGESTLEDRLLDLIEGQQDPTIAPYAKEGEVTIRLTTRASNPEEGEARMQGTLAVIRERLGPYLYSEEGAPIERAVVELLKQQGRTLAAAESCTGGLLSDLVTSISGCSSVFKGGVVSYSNELKHKLLRVPMNVLEGDGAPGAVSEQTARLMAEHLRADLDTDYAVSVTGVAGPEPSEGKPVGLVYIGIAERGGDTAVYEVRFNGSREMVKLRAAKLALYRIWQRLAGRME